MVLTFFNDYFAELSRIKMDNKGLVSENDENGPKRLVKKKSADHILFSTMSLMNCVTNDIDISSPLSCAIMEEDLGKIRSICRKFSYSLFTFYMNI